MSNTPNNDIPYVPENTIDPAAGLNEALRVIDTLVQLRIISITNTLPDTPADGARYLVGTSPTGAAVGHAGEIATYNSVGNYYFFDNANYALLGTVLYVNNGSNIWDASAGGGITSVNGDTGPAVTLDAADVSAAPSSHVGSGGSQHADVVAAGASGFMTGADKTKLDGVASGSTANSSDSTLLDRANHTGTQLAATISDFAATVRGTLLTGYSVGAVTAIAATDSVLQAFGKIGAWLAALGTAAFKNTGTSGDAVPLLNAANTWSATQSLFASAPALLGGAAHSIVAAAAVQSWGYDDNIVSEYITCSAVAAAYSPKFNMHRGRGTMASPAACANGDSLGAFQFKGYTSGSGWVDGASVSASVIGTPSSGFNPVAIYFATSNGSTGNTARWSVAPSGELAPVTNNAYDIGTAALQVRAIYAVGGVFTGPVKPGSYTVATLPSAAANTGAQIYVSNMAGGAECATSNGTNWRRNSDLTTAS
jgi:hypothetical protein